MKLLIVSVFWIVFAPLGSAQVANPRPARNKAQATQAKPENEVLPQTTLDFQPVGVGLPLSFPIVALNHPVCSSDGTYYLNAVMLPRGERQVIAVSPTDKDAVTNYNMGSIPGLVDVQPRLMDVNGSNLYLLAEAAKSDDLINHDVEPGSPEARKYRKSFILHFHGSPSEPDVIQLDLPFYPEQFAATSEGKFIFLGLNRTNQTAVLAVAGGSGEFERYIDAYSDFGTSDSMVANAPQRLKRQYKAAPTEASLDFLLVTAQFVHAGDSLLLLMPGAKSKVITIRGGALESTALHLPAGLEADSLIPSDSGWLVRAKDGAANGNELIVMIDPSDGKALRIIHSPQFGVNAITCAHDGDYYGIRWPRGGKGDEKAFLMEASQ